MRDRQNDLRRMQKRVVNQAVMYRTLDSRAIFIVELRGRLNFDSKANDSRWVLQFIGSDPNPGATAGQFVLPQIQRRAESGTRPERDK
jgi:hypothetical protein